MLFSSELIARSERLEFLVSLEDVSRKIVDHIKRREYPEAQELLTKNLRELRRRRVECDELGEMQSYDEVIEGYEFFSGLVIDCSVGGVVPEPSLN